MGGIDLHLVVELSAEEVQNHGGDGPGNILPVTSKKERKKKRNPRVYDIRIRDDTAKTGNGEWPLSKKKGEKKKKKKT